MSALSDFLTTGTAPWWGAPVGAILGALAGQAVSARSTRKSDERKFDQSQIEAETKRKDDRRKERLQHAQTIGIRLITGADELVEALTSQHEQFSKLYERMTATDDPIDFEPIKTAFNDIFRSRDEARKGLNGLRAELEIVGSPRLITSAKELLEAANRVGPTSDEEEADLPDDDLGYLSPDAIVEARRAYDTSREAMVRALRQFVNDEEE